MLTRTQDHRASEKCMEYTKKMEKKSWKKCTEMPLPSKFRLAFLGGTGTLGRKNIVWNIYNNCYRSPPAHSSPAERAEGQRRQLRHPGTGKFD